LRLRGKRFVQVADLPDYYFRVRENGALVFRVEANGRSGRIEMDPIASVTLRSGEIKPQGGRRALSPGDMAAIEAWIDERRGILAARGRDDIDRVVEQLNMTAHWAQTRAEDAALDRVTDALLLAMHDLRTVLVRKRADRLRPGEK